MNYKTLLIIFFYLYNFIRISLASSAGAYLDMYRDFSFQNSLIYILFSIILYLDLKISKIILYRCKSKKEYLKSLFKISFPSIIIYLLQIEAILFMFSVSDFNIIYIVQHMIFTFLNLCLCTLIIIGLTMYIKEYLAYFILLVFIIVSATMDLFRVGNVVYNNLNFANFGSLDLSEGSVISIFIIYSVILTSISILGWYRRNEDI